MAIKVDLVVSRHPALIELLPQYGFDIQNAQVLTHVADPSVLDGKVVVGNLPMHLAARCQMIISPTILVPPELRGKELTVDQLKQYLKGFAAYRVVEVPLDLVG